MPLLSIEFILFFLVFFPLYWAVRKPLYQNILLIISGLGWLYYLSPLFALSVFLFSLIINLISELMLMVQTDKKRLHLYQLGIVFTLIQLIFFKYYDFFKSSFQERFNQELIDILLPLGLSYYSFQAISYLTSLYYQKPVKLKWHNLLLHFSLFLTITAGPIARVDNFKHGNEHYLGMKSQLETSSRREIIIPHLAIGLILLGLAKKWWFAGMLAEQIVTPVFENPSQYDLLNLLAAIYGYTFQLFFDFSGYSDLVIGLAMLLGIQLPRNFNMPFISTNIREFWKRWHISLSSWIRDYIYIPLGGNKYSFSRTQCYLLIAMLLSGIWHGYGYNFFLWGLLHGLAIVMLNIIEKFTSRKIISDIPFIGKATAIFITFNFVSFTFVIFRTNNLEETLFIYQSLWENRLNIDLSHLHALLMLILFAMVLVCYRHLAKAFEYFCYDLSQMPLILWGLIVTLIAFFIVLFAPSGIPAFIYANF